MLSKQNRLTRTKDIQAVLKGRAIKRQGVLLRIGAQEPGLPPRIAVVVGRRVSKKATMRNRIKRQIREAIRQLIRDIPQGMKCVITALPESKTMKFQELKEEIRQALLHIIRVS